MAVQLAHLCRSNSFPLRPRRVKTERQGVKSGHSSAHKPGKYGLSCKANKCSNAGTGNLGWLLTQEASSMKIGNAGENHPGDCHHKYNKVHKNVVLEP